MIFENIFLTFLKIYFFDIFENIFLTFLTMTTMTTTTMMMMMMIVVVRLVEKVRLVEILKKKITGLLLYFA